MRDDSVPWGALNSFPGLLAKPTENKYDILEWYVHSSFLLTIAICILCVGEKNISLLSLQHGIEILGFL